eukprot:Hpha_TRINITY_DN13127_c0_g1::TRINITY_DN13127_c0_g1_i1::g.113859::m.113859/K07178/RIOK1; RIO kinase 1
MTFPPGHPAAPQHRPMGVSLGAGPTRNHLGHIVPGSAAPRPQPLPPAPAVGDGPLVLPLPTLEDTQAQAAAQAAADAEEVQRWKERTERRRYGADDVDDVSDDSDWDVDVGIEGEDYRAGGKVVLGGAHYNRQAASQSTMQPTTHSKTWSKITLDSQTHGAQKSIRKAEDMGETGKFNVRDKQERATVEQVLDPRTRMILFKLVNGGWLHSINGCVSTGKEANVYHAPGPAKDYAIKVYKTSILVFKDREKYVKGEHRFRRGYCKSNPRKMVRTWAEKEFRNLKRLEAAGIPCPKTELLRQHVLVMDFIGKDGWPAPRLKDVRLGEEKLRVLYVEMLKIMRTIFHECKLVHGDLSEYNMLYMDGKIYVIDVSQSVEHEHPRALEFLRQDCVNVTQWFRQQGLTSVMRLQQLFCFVIDPSIPPGGVDKAIDDVLEKMESAPEDDAKAKVDEEVFRQIHLPRSFTEIGKAENWQERLLSGDQERTTQTLMLGSAVPRRGDDSDSESHFGDEEESESEDGEPKEGEEVDEESYNKRGMKWFHERSTGETPDERRERKRLVKEEQAQRRREKKEQCPKALRKRREKQAKVNSKKK